jgi:hypothetical protein
MCPISARVAGHIMSNRAPLIILGVALLALNAAGSPYYVLSLAERVRSPLHPWFRSSGYVGQTAGILSFLIFTFLWLYPLRKRFRWLRFTGAVPKWLNVHILAGLCIPLLVGAHAGWRFTGLAGLSYAAMVVVVLSGFVGRYVYSRIPRHRDGLEMTFDEIRSSLEEQGREIAAAAGMSPESVREILLGSEDAARQGGILATFRQMIRDDIHRRRTMRRLRRDWGKTLDRKAVGEALRLSRRHIALSQQLRLLQATQGVFRFWHAAHRPVAVTALLAVVIHVTVVVALGSTWFR